MPQQANIPYWEKRWQSALDRSPLQRRRLKDGMRRWNKMAADFVKRTAPPIALTYRGRRRNAGRFLTRDW